MDEKFISELLTILELPNEQNIAEVELKKGNWDSMALLATISWIDEIYGINVPTKNLSECKTISDILKLIRQTQEYKE